MAVESLKTEGNWQPHFPRSLCGLRGVSRCRRSRDLSVDKAHGFLVDCGVVCAVVGGREVGRLDRLAEIDCPQVVRGKKCAVLFSAAVERNTETVRSGHAKGLPSLPGERSGRGEKKSARSSPLAAVKNVSGPVRSNPARKCQRSGPTVCRWSVWGYVDWGPVEGRPESSAVRSSPIKRPKNERGPVHCCAAKKRMRSGPDDA